MRILLWFVLLVYAARQIFDESIPCLGIQDDCPGSNSDIKDDENFPPYDGEICPSIIQPEETPNIYDGEENEIS